MNREQLLRKLENDEELTPMESALLETYLDEEAGSRTLEAIRALKREDPSFAWRARLNERLTARAAKRNRPRLRVSLAFGSAIAAVAAITFVFARLAHKPAPADRINLTSYLYEWHEEASAAVLLPRGGTDLNALVNEPSRPHDDDLDDLLYGKNVVESL